MTKKTSKSDFARSLKWSPEFALEWNGFVGMHTLDGDRLVKIELVCTCNETVHRVRVTVINKVTGPVDETVFPFEDLLSMEMSDRTDVRHEWRGGMYLWAGAKKKGWEWYVATPKTTRPLCAAIEAHVRLFR